MQARAATIVIAILAAMALSTSANAETCTFEDTATKKQFQAECDTDVTRLSAAQVGQRCRLPSQSLKLSAGEQPPSAARPCKDENDTNCYSLVTLECR
jgi:hypothetical protein